MGNISSGNFQKVSKHSFFHNDRTEKKTAKTVKTEHSHKNEFDISAVAAEQKYDELYGTYLKIRKEKKQRAKVAKANTLVECVVNINEKTTMEDLKKVQKYIEKRFGFQGLQIAIHRDEGYYDRNNNDEWTPNLHAHLSFFTISENTNIQMFRKEHIKPHDLREFQTELAQILGMERGIDNRVSKRERLSHKDYKQHKIRIEKQETEYKKIFDNYMDQVEAGMKLKQSEISDLKKQIQTYITNMTVSAYEKNQLHEKNRDLEKELKKLNKQKQLDFETFQKKINEFEFEIEKKETELQKKPKVVKVPVEVPVEKIVKVPIDRVVKVENTEKINDLAKQLQLKNSKLHDVVAETTELKEKIASLRNVADRKKEENTAYIQKIDYLENQLMLAKDTYDDVVAENDTLKLALESEKAELSQQNDENIKKIDYLENQLELANDGYDDVVAENDALKHSETGLKRRIDALETQNKGSVLKTVYDSLKSKFSDMKTKFNDLVEKYNRLLEKYKLMKAENIELKEKIATLRNVADRKKEKTELAFNTDTDLTDIEETNKQMLEILKRGVVVRTDMKVK
jgi:DNA repair exonuclease SbcCD ATPase subunit